MPPALIEQLASPGRMFIPVGTFMQYIEQIDKDAEGNITTQKVMGVRVRLYFKQSFIIILELIPVLQVCSVDRPTRATRE